MKICTKEDSEEIKSILTHPDLWDRISDDYCVPAGDFNVSDTFFNGEYIILMPNPGSVIIFRRINNILYDIHVNILPAYRGATAKESVLSCMNWLYNHTNCHTISCMIPTIYPDVIKFAMKCGYVPRGVLHQSHIKNDKLSDIVILQHYNTR